MYRGFYIAANGIINQQRVLDVTSNNIANVQTAGFKSDENIPSTFERQLVLIRGKKNTTGTIEYITNEKTQTSLEQGTFQFTNRKLDVAIKGDVYFNIQPTGTLYKDDNVLLTRNGQFDIDNEGYLTLGGSGRVLGTDGPIQIGTADFTIDEKGVITTSDGKTYNLKLSYLDKTQDVQKKGDNMFKPNTDTPVPADAEYSIIQGAYERSNVDVTEEMTRAMQAQRIFEACSQALKQVDTINQRAVSELAKI